MGLELKLRSLLKLNYKLLLDQHFLRDSAYINVPSGALFYDGSDMSILLPDTSADNSYIGVVDGQVWQSPFRQWVYESGVALDGLNTGTPPITASGVLIEGAFRATDDSVFGHTIDFSNGRIIFNSPQSSDLKVNVAFAAREVRIGFEHDFNQQFQNSTLNSKYFTNPLNPMQGLVYPSGLIQSFPAIFIEADGREFEGFELGNRSAIIEEELKLYVWALDDMQRDNIVDIVTGQWRKSIPIIDFNRAPLPLSGIFNTLSPEYVPYQTMLRNDVLVTTVGSGVPIRYISYVEDVNTRNIIAAEEYERTLITFKVKVYLNAPTTPLGHTFGPITTIPSLGDTVF